MRFLLPHVEPKMENNVIKREEESDTEDDPPMRFRCVPSMPSLPDLSFPSESNEEDQDSQPSPKKPRLNSTDEEGCHCNRNDPDELFLLSCAPILQRLSAKQNAGARLKIQQVLYEAEFGMQAELPYLTPAGEVIGVIQDLHEPVD